MFSFLRAGSATVVGSNETSGYSVVPTSEQGAAALAAALPPDHFETIVPRPSDEVWTFVSKYEEWICLLRPLKQTQRVFGQSGLVGTTYRQIQRFHDGTLDEFTRIVTEATPGQSLTFTCFVARATEEASSKYEERWLFSSLESDPLSTRIVAGIIPLVREDQQRLGTPHRKFIELSADLPLLRGVILERIPSNDPEILNDEDIKIVPN